MRGHPFIVNWRVSPRNHQYTMKECCMTLQGDKMSERRLLEWFGIGCRKERDLCKSESP
jgi:hypothetical protein